MARARRERGIARSHPRSSTSSSCARLKYRPGRPVGFPRPRDGPSSFGRLASGICQRICQNICQKLWQGQAGTRSDVTPGSWGRHWPSRTYPTAFCRRAWRTISAWGARAWASAGHPETGQAAAPGRPTASARAPRSPRRAGRARARGSRRAGWPRRRSGAPCGARPRRARGDSTSTPQRRETADVQQQVRHPRGARESARRHHLQAVEGEVVPRPGLDVEDADPSRESLGPRELAPRVEELGEDGAEGLREHVDPPDRHAPRAAARLESPLVLALEVPAQGPPLRLDVLHRQAGDEGDALPGRSVGRSRARTVPVGDWRRSSGHAR